MKEPKDIKIPDQVKLADGIKKYQKCREKTKQHLKMIMIFVGFVSWIGYNLTIF